MYKRQGRQTRWKYLAQLVHTIALYESPHRLVKCVREITEYLGADRETAVIKEISKLYETIYRGQADEVLTTLEALPSIKGEYVVVIGSVK